MARDAPSWGTWTTLYDPVGQAPGMSRFDNFDVLIVRS